MLISKKLVGLLALISVTSMAWQTEASADTMDNHRLPSVLQKAERALENEDPDRAIGLLEGRIDAMRHQVAQAQAHTLMCKAHYQKQDYLSAEKSCDLAVTTDRLNWSHLNNRGVMRFMLGRYDEALNDFSHAGAIALLPASTSQSRSIRNNVSAAQRHIASR